MQYSLEMTNTPYLVFEAERPLIHVLLATTRTFVKTILSNFVKLKILRNTPLKLIDMADPNSLVEVNDIVYIGPDAKATVCTMTKSDACNLKPVVERIMLSYAFKF